MYKWIDHRNEAIIGEYWKLEEDVAPVWWEIEYMYYIIM